MNTINLAIKFKPLTIQLGDKELEIHELSIPLPFGRKPSNINDITSFGHSTVYVTDTREMAPEEFDGFSMNLHKPRDWLKGKGGLLCKVICASWCMHLVALTFLWMHLVAIRFSIWHAWADQ